MLRVEVEEQPDVTPPTALTAELEREYRAVVEEILELRGDDGRISAFVRSITDPGALADTAGYSPDLNLRAEDSSCSRRWTSSSAWRCRCASSRSAWPSCRCASASATTSSTGAQKQQRDYFLRKQMDAIRKELGENEASVAEDYRKKIADAGMPEAVLQQAERELSRFERMGDQNAEASMIRTYLDWLLAVPWSKRSEEQLDPQHAREVLDADHAGLDDVKERITEYLAVRKLRAERGLSRRQAIGRDPDADRPSGHGQDLDRRVDRAGHRPASSCACRSAACATRPRSAVTGAPTSARCRAGWCARCATPGR